MPAEELRARLHTGRLARALTRVLAAEALTLGSRIFLSDAAVREVNRGSREGERLLNHELAHVAQFAREGAARFLSKYAFAYARARCAGLSHAAAYGEIPFERDARAAESPSP